MKFYTTQEAAEILRTTKQYLAILIRKGKLRASQPNGRKWLISHDDLLAFVEGAKNEN